MYYLRQGGSECLTRGHVLPLEVGEDWPHEDGQHQRGHGRVKHLTRHDSRILVIICKVKK